MELTYLDIGLLLIGLGIGLFILSLQEQNSKKHKKGDE